MAIYVNIVVILHPVQPVDRALIAHKRSICIFQGTQAIMFASTAATLHRVRRAARVLKAHSKGTNTFSFYHKEDIDQNGGGVECTSGM